METAYPKYARASRAFALNINKISLLYSMTSAIEIFVMLCFARKN